MMTPFAPFRRIILCVLILSLSSSGFAFNAEDWSVEEVLVKVLEANGGRENIDAISDVRMRGVIEGAETNYDFLLLKKRPNKLRVHLISKGRSVETGFDGIRGWQRVWQGPEDTVRELDSAEMAETGLDTYFDGPLISRDRPLVTRSLEGVERINRTDYFLVKVVEPKAVTVYYVDSRTFREWKTVRTVLDKDGEVKDTIETIFEDYAKYAGIWIAETVIRTTSNGAQERIILNDIELNAGILDRAFVIPHQWSDQE